MPKLTTKTISLRQSVIISVARLIEEGKATSERDALNIALKECRRHGIALGFSENTDRAYDAYLKFKKSSAANQKRKAGYE